MEAREKRSGRARYDRRHAILGILLLVPIAVSAAEWTDGVADALSRAGANRLELQRALRAVDPRERQGMEFLIANMPPEDLRTLGADLLSENVELAYQAWREAPWRETVPQAIFLEAVLPYAVIDERRDRWRSVMRDLALPIVRGIDDPALAVARLNQTIYRDLDVRYDVTRSRTNQSAREVMAEHKATCTGLSILLIDACRAVGIPARLAGVPLWTDDSGNHSWVEVWTGDGWHFTGAAEPAEDRLDDAWFTERAAAARRDDPVYAVYAINYSPTGILFPRGWDGVVDDINAINVTDRYTGTIDPDAEGFAPPEGMSRVDITVFDHPGGRRIARAIEVRDAAGRVVFRGTTASATADMRNSLSTLLPRGRTYDVRLESGRNERVERLRTEEPFETCTLVLEDAPGPAKSGWGRAR
ncbi:MAG: transglutaminase-like domain-containing protein [Candidatus Eisenbacteria bacterium]